MHINIYGAKCIGIDATKVTVEVDINSGVGIHLVGLADVAVKESLLRTVTALQYLGFRIPGKKIVINLAPADLHKNGSGYDVPIAIGIIAASGQRELPGLEHYIIMGELGLDGRVRPVPGALPTVELARKEGFRGCILPKMSAFETLDFEEGEIFGVEDLREVIDILSEDEDSRQRLLIKNLSGLKTEDHYSGKPSETMDFSEIIGQERAKRGLEIAAAGGHNIIMIGPPGSGKSSLAKALAGILPQMTRDEAVETSKIYSVSGGLNGQLGLIRQRPYRSPHYSISLAALLGGGSDQIMPGEVSLSHNGVLFCDEFCEAPKKIIEALRAPIEDRKVSISRLKTRVEFPSSFMLVAATNPCPCGYYGEGDRCCCGPAKRDRYLSKLSGPIMDRIDIHLWMHRVDAAKMVRGAQAESSAVVAERVARARAVQSSRFASEGISTNSEMTAKMIARHCIINEEGKQFLEKMMTSLGLSARACSRILKLSRTIADLEGSADISLEHLSEAAGLRFLDKMSE